MDIIYFYSSRKGNFRAFSNFFKSPVFIHQQLWPTVEHWFQAQKFLPTDPDWSEHIRTAPSAGKAALWGRSRAHPLRNDWEEVKDEIMYQGQIAKYSQHENLWVLLHSTGNKKLVEKTTKDKYWGCGTDGKGLNKLGVILMQVRGELKAIMAPGELE